jgi:hypothetical protein
VAFVTLLRRLLRHKVLLALAVVAGIVVGLLMSYKVKGPFDLQSKSYSVGVATARILVDTPSSQIVDLGNPQPDKALPVDIGTLSARATLLASLMTSSPIKDDIARAAGVDDSTLLTPSTGPGGGGQAPLPGDVSATSKRANILKASVPELASGSIPIIVVDTQSPDADTAARLADQSVIVLRRQLDSLAGTEAIPADRRVTIRELGPAHATTQVRGTSRIVAAGAGVVTFLAGCALILLLFALIEGWRNVVADERRASGGAGAPGWLKPVIGTGGDEEDEEDGDDEDDDAAPPPEREREHAPTREAAGILWPATRRHDAG